MIDKKIPTDCRDCDSIEPIIKSPALDDPFFKESGVGCYLAHHRQIADEENYKMGKTARPEWCPLAHGEKF